MTRVDHQAIHRSVGAMVFSISERATKKAQESADYALGEIEMQFQIDIAGEALGVVWNEITIPFSEILYDAPQQRKSDNDEPQVWFGKVIDSPDPVFVDAHVSDWEINESGHTTGMTVRVGVFDPAAGDITKVRFSGRLHVTVQGLGAPQDNADGVDGEGA